MVAQDALNRLKRSSDRGIGCHLSADMVQALRDSPVGQIWSQPDPRKVRPAPIAGKRSDVTPAILRELINYDPVAGLLTWKPRAVSWFRPADRTPEDSAKTWNGRYANKPLGQRANDFAITVSILYYKFHAHRVAWAIYYGEWPIDQVDHINGNPYDNRIVNLRAVDSVGNRRNVELSRKNKTGHHGVRKAARAGRWEATIGDKGTNRYLGSFDTFDDAVAARKAAEVDLGYHPNHGRLPRKRKSAAILELGGS